MVFPEGKLFQSSDAFNHRRQENMYKSGLIFGAVMLVAGLVITLFLPYCVPCVALVIGLIAGYVGGVYGKPSDQPQATKSGAITGAIAGVGVILGEMIGAVINSVMVKPDQINQILKQFGFSTGTQLTTGQYWAAQLGVNCCLSLFSVALMAGLGAVGGLLWWNYNGKKQALPPGFLPPQ
jgi:hypothetical protein